MALIFSALIGDKMYYFDIKNIRTFSISAAADANLTVSELGNMSFSVEIYDNMFHVKRLPDGAEFTGEYGIPIVIDREKRIAFLADYAKGNPLSVDLPLDCDICVGRTYENGKTQHNNIILNYSFVSRTHFRIERRNGVSKLIDCESTNGIFLNGKQVHSAVLRDGDIISIFTIRFILRKNSLVIENAGDKCELKKISGLNIVREAPMTGVNSAKTHFSRAPRISAMYEKEIINIEAPMQYDRAPEINWMSVLVTPLISAGLMLLLVFVLGMSPAMLIMSGAMSIISAVAAIANYRKQKNKHVEKINKIDSVYGEYLKELSDRLNAAHAQQLNCLRTAYPDVKSCQRIVEKRDKGLWNRTPVDSDFLCARIGTGSIPAAMYAVFNRNKLSIEDNKLENDASFVANNSTVINDAPITCDLLSSAHTGIIGNRPAELALTRNVIISLVASHSYEDLRIVVLTSENEGDAWKWMRWLPHCADNPKQKRYIFTTAEDAEKNLSEVEETLNRRKASLSDTGRDSGEVLLPHYLFIVADSSIMDCLPIKKLILADGNIGCSALFICNKINLLPKECKQIIEVDGNCGYIYDRFSSNNRLRFDLEPFDIADADTVARSMAPIAITSDNGVAALPSSVSFLEGYGVNRPEELDIAQRWSKSKTYKSLSVPVASLGDDVFEFDIHEKKHGVNGIVAGMPGSGKTEMVQSWLLSLAVNFSPEDVSFVLIDFKGTGMIAPFKNLPHLAGSISNLDSNIDRNLIAIQSEVHRREAIIDKYSDRSIKNINDLNKAFDAGKVPEKLPILIIAIDEYAEFKKVFPDFGAEIDSLTSKGRALGIFVVLMTQKPAGVVSPKSEDNIKFRWCLKVANFSASREMLGKPDAAKIVNPGRAFIKVGEDDVYEEVQSFWSGAPYDPAKQLNASGFTVISRVDLNGKRTALERKEIRKSESGITEIDAVVGYICDYCSKNHIPSAKKVWTDKLPSQIALSDVMKDFFDGTDWPDLDEICPVIGLADDPGTQSQFPMALDLSGSGHTLIYGAPMTGKTTLLKTLTVSIAMTLRPDAVSLYVIDCGGWNMGIFRNLPHMGGIANDNEPERIGKLIQLIDDILLERREKFSKVGVSNIEAYRDITGEKMPAVVLLVDNLGALLKLYQNIDTFFMNLTSSGANYGVYLVATAISSNSVSTRITQNVKNAVCMQMVDKSDYTYIVGRVSSALPNIMGRGYAKGNPPMEFQTALPAPGEDDKSVADNVYKLVQSLGAAWSGELPAPIPQLPERIPYGSIKVNSVALGLSCDKVQPVIFDHIKQHFLLISSIDAERGKSLLRTVARQLKERIGGNLAVFSPDGIAPKEFVSYADAFRVGANEIDSFVTELRPELQKRYAMKQEDETKTFAPIIITIDDFAKFFTVCSNDTVSRLLAIVKMGKGLEIYLVTQGDALELSRLYNKGEVVTVSLGKATQTVMLGGCINDHGAVSSKASYSQKNVPMKDGEGMLVQNGEPRLFKAMESKEDKQ